MKFIAAGLLIIIIATACSQTAEQLGEAKPVYAFPDTLCFKRYSGLKNQDTTSISLIINDDRVSGTYLNYPFEKDARKGVIRARKVGDDIAGTWFYTQEGVADSIAVEFKLGNNFLMQKQTSFDPMTGREFLADTATFRLKYARIQCLESRNRP